MASHNRDTRAIVVGTLLILLVGGGFLMRRLWSTSDGETPEAVPAPAEESKALPEITADVVRQKMANGEKVQFLDLRDRDSFQGEHIPHSLLLSPSTLSTFTPDTESLQVIVFSAKDTQTLEVIKNSLRQKSFPVFLLSGGFEGWKKGGNQTISIGDPSSFIDQSKVTYITPSEAQALIAGTGQGQGVFLLDVQTEEHYRSKHIRGAKNIPLNELERRSSEVPPGENIIVYGESDIFSFQGGVRLSDLGIFSAKTLGGNSHLDPTSGFILEP